MGLYLSRSHALRGNAVLAAQAARLVTRRGHRDLIVRQRRGLSSPVLLLPDTNVQRCRKRRGELLDLGLQQRSDVVSEDRLRQADEFIAMDARFVFQTFLHTDKDLCRESVKGGVDRRTDQG